MEVTPKWWKRGDVWRRIGSDVAALIVGLNAAYLSWGHIVATSIMYHQTGLAAYLYPLSIDGAMVVGVVKAADDRANGRKVRPWARVVTWAGGGVSIYAQIASAWHYGYWAAGWATVPSLFLIGVVEVQARRGKFDPRAKAPVETVATVPVAGPVVPAEPVTVLDESVPTPEPTEPLITVTEAPEVTLEPVRRARRRPTVRGYPGTGLDDAKVTADMLALTASAPATVPAFVEPTVSPVDAS
jgi:hypothetical protein